MADEAKPEFRLLIIGGKSKDVPRDRILCEFTHYDSDEAKNRLKRGEISFSLGKEPHLILAMRDYINHAPVERFKKAAKTYGIAFVAASGGFWTLVNKARARGYDVGPLIAPAERRPTGEVVKPPKSELDLDPEMVAWINGYPRSAYKLRVIGGQEIPVINTKRGVSLLMKGRPLEYALSLISVLKLGTGKRGAIRQGEARQIIERLEQVYKLKQFGIKAPQELSVIKNLGYVLGTNSAAATKEMASKASLLGTLREAASVKSKSTPLKEHEEHGKLTCTAHKGGPTEARCMFCALPCDDRLAEYKKEETPPPEPDPEPTPTPEPEPEPEPAPEPEAPKAGDPLERISALYERLIDAQSENASYMEQIGKLEEDLKRKDVKIKELEEKVKALAK